MKVPDDWWPGFTGNNLNGWVIAFVDLDIATNNHFQLELDNELDLFYAMRCGAIVSCCADKMHRSYSSFCLPTHALSDPANEVVIVEDVNEDNDDDDDF